MATPLSPVHRSGRRRTRMNMKSGGPVRTIPVARRRTDLDALEPDVVLGQGRRSPLRRADVRKLRELKLDVERIAALEPVQHRGHEPGEVLGAPDAPERVGGVALEQ